eukprot:CAMPEP_0168329796 /NCGR_PEP_ID=MMETSP0213-20121227/7327_1 /TAXON_ID=151035 /ORGANISM="Euplotes harpa, Strain FSP1.4" /LENGTH=68 /DNA_ID=CAMNT_0008333201 /DNA_START=18 /DNA_END=221 /DNA_ORIENTATION=+
MDPRPISNVISSLTKPSQGQIEATREETEDAAGKLKPCEKQEFRDEEEDDITDINVNEHLRKEIQGFW